MKAILTAVIVVFVGTGVIWGEIINVPDDHETIQGGIDAAEEGDTVLVQPGEYVENIDFDGKNITVASLFLTTGEERYIEETVIDGDENGSVVTFENEESEEAALNGFCITNGRAVHGGGIHLQSANPIIRNCLVAQNFSEHDGGGIYCINNSNPLIINCVIIDNYAEDEGGGIIVANDSEPIISGCLIGENSTDGFGGGLYSGRSSPTIISCTFSRNIAEDGGGGILCSNNSNPIFQNTILWNDNPQEVYFRSEWESNSITIDYSNIQGGEQSIVTNGNGEVHWGESNIDADPLFVDPDDGDFQLTEDSPCIDAGDPESPEDPDGTRADMGALYFDQAPSIRVEPDAIDFGEVAVDETAEQTLTIFNDGRLPLTIEDITVDNETFRTEWDDEAPQFDWEFVVGNLMSIIVRDALIDGESLIEGDYVGVFDEEGNIGGYTQVDEDGFPLGLAVYDENFPEDMIEQGIELYFRLWDTSAASEYAARTDLIQVLEYIENGFAVVTLEATEILRGDGEEELDAVIEPGGELEIGVYFSPFELGEQVGELTVFSDDEDNPEVVVELSGIGVGHFIIPLHAGWQMVSSPVPPPDPDMEDVFDQIVRNGMEPMVKDNLGRFFFPPMGFNNMDPWDVRYGYLVCMDEPDTLFIAGQPVPVDTPIPLDETWSIVAYFPEQPIPAIEAFANIEDVLAIAKDDIGRFYVPRLGFSNMRPLQRGEGYQVRVNQECELVWNVPEEEVLNFEFLVLSDQDMLHFPSHQPTGKNMSLLIELLGPTQNSKLKIQDFEIAAFTPSGLCVGVAALTGTTDPSRAGRNVCPPGGRMWGMAVWGDDPTTEAVDGAVEGDPITFRMWDGVREIAVEPSWIEGDGLYTTDGFAVIGLSMESALPTDFTIDYAYPNPFNSSVRIRYSMPQQDVVTIKVFDIAGRIVETLCNEHREAGRHIVTWDASGSPSGVYLSWMESCGRVRLAKLALVQ